MCMPFLLSLYCLPRVLPASGFGALPVTYRQGINSQEHNEHKPQTAGNCVNPSPPCPALLPALGIGWCCQSDAGNNRRRHVVALAATGDYMSHDQREGARHSPLTDAPPDSCLIAPSVPAGTALPCSSECQMFTVSTIQRGRSSKSAHATTSRQARPQVTLTPALLPALGQGG
jgi:hypothetical protein